MTARLIVCGDCGEQKPPHTRTICARCYQKRYRRGERFPAERSVTFWPAGTGLRADGLLTSDYYRRWQASRRPGLPSRVYRVQTDDAGLVRVARRVL